MSMHGMIYVEILCQNTESSSLNLTCERTFQIFLDQVTFFFLVNDLTIEPKGHTLKSTAPEYANQGISRSFSGFTQSH